MWTKHPWPYKAALWKNDEFDAFVREKVLARKSSVEMFAEWKVLYGGNMIYCIGLHRTTSDYIGLHRTASDYIETASDCSDIE